MFFQTVLQVQSSRNSSNTHSRTLAQPHAPSHPPTRADFWPPATHPYPTAQGPFIVHQGPNSLRVFLVEVNKDLNQHLRPGCADSGGSRGKMGGIDGEKGMNPW